MNTKRQNILGLFDSFKIIETGLIRKILFMVQKNMNGIIIGNNVYLNNKGGDKSLFFILFHEEIHRKRKQKIGTLKFYVQYLLPQIFTIMSLFSFLAIPFSLRFLYFLLFLLFVLPLKAKYRTAFEEEAYAYGITLKKELGYEIDYDRYIELFSSWGYWKMDKDYQQERLALCVEHIKKNDYIFIANYIVKFHSIFKETTPSP